MASSDPLHILIVGEVRFHGWTGDQDKWFGEDGSIDGGVVVSEMEMGLRALVASFIRVEQHRGQKNSKRAPGQWGKDEAPLWRRRRHQGPIEIEAAADGFISMPLTMSRHPIDRFC